MIYEINLKNEKFLKAYEEQIKTLPLDELYDVLDIIKSDPSRERIDIVEKRIQELEEHPEREAPQEFPEITLTPVTPPQTSPKDSSQTSSQAPSQTPPPVTRRTLTDEDMEEIHQVVDEIVERYKNNPPEAKPPKRKKPRHLFYSWITWTLGFGMLAFSQIRGGWRYSKGARYYIPEHSLFYTVSYAPFACFVAGYLMGACHKKDRALDLGIAAFLMFKSIIGLLFGFYQGLVISPSPFFSYIISATILTLSLIFTVNIFTSKRKGRFYENAWPLLLNSLAIEQIGWLEVL